MRHLKKKITPGADKSHKKALLRNMATSLFLHEKIETTSAKAKALRSYADKLITLAKKDTLASRRQAIQKLTHKNAVKKLFEVLGPKYKAKAGGYTTVNKISNRKGDNGETSVIKLA